jgi:hypothetical protein
VIRASWLRTWMFGILARLFPCLVWLVIIYHLHLLTNIVQRTCRTTNFFI